MATYYAAAAVDDDDDDDDMQLRRRIIFTCSYMQVSVRWYIGMTVQFQKSRTP